MATTENVNTDLLRAAESVVTTVRHVEPVRRLAMELSRVTRNAYVCPDGCGQGAYPIGADDVGYGEVDDPATKSHVHNDDLDSVGEGRH